MAHLYRNVRLLGLVAITSAVATPACAQTSPSSSDALRKSAAVAKRAGQLEEIVVTANKRQETARKVPISIGVLSGKTILEHHIDGYEDVTRALPGVSFASGGAPGQDNISVRGISTTVGNPTVGIYMDEIPIITSSGFEGAAEPRPLDLARIEVLRGPQGTVYGASSEGGTIRFITNQPDLNRYSAEVDADASGTYRGGPNTDDQITVNIPVVKDSFALRISGELLNASGWINSSEPNESPKRGTNYQRTGVTRVTGKLKVSDDFTITPSFFYQNLNVGDTSSFYENEGTYNQRKFLREPIHDRYYIPSLTIHKGIGNFADLTSVSSYFIRDVDRVEDATTINSAAVAQYYLDPAFPSYKSQNDNTLGNIPSPAYFTERFKTLTQEVRLASKPNSRLQWVIGFFYSDQKWSHDDNEPTVGFSSTFQKIYGVNINDSILGEPSDPGLWDNDNIWHITDHNEVKQYAGFGQVDYSPIQRLHLSAGMRYVSATETFSEVGSGFFDYGNAGTTGTPYRQKANFEAPTPKFSINFDVSKHTMVYATIAKGFRLGGATTPNTNVSCVEGLHQLGLNGVPASYGSDQLWSYEAGLKTLVLRNTLSVNVAGYYIDWSRIQQTITIPICGGAFNYNVGNAAAYGGELEARYRPEGVPGLTVGANFGAEHATITSTINTQTALVGQNVLFTPRWSASANVDYYHALTQNITGFIRADYDWVGKSNGSFTISDPNYRDPAYGVVNLSMGLDTRGWEMSIYAKNLLDNTEIIQRPVIDSVTEAYTLQPLTIGLHVSKRF